MNNNPNKDQNSEAATEARLQAKEKQLRKMEELDQPSLITDQTTGRTIKRKREKLTPIETERPENPVSREQVIKDAGLVPHTKLHVELGIKNPICVYCFPELEQTQE